MCQSLFYNKVAGVRFATALKRGSGTGVFMWILRIFKNTFFIEHLWATASTTSSNGSWTSILPTRHAGLGMKCLVDFNAGKTQLNWTVWITVLLLIWKKIVCPWRKNISLDPELDWRFYTFLISLQENWSYDSFHEFFPSDVPLYFFISFTSPCMEYCCHVGSGTSNCNLGMLKKLQNREYRTVGPTLAALLEP